MMVWSSLRARSVALLGCLGLLACAPQTGLIFEVQGPEGSSSAEIAELELITAHRSYCERWVADTTASGSRYSVVGRDLEAEPLSILLSPDERTDVLMPDEEYAEPDQLVRATVLARDATGQLIGLASFDALPFKYEEVRKYRERINLLGRGSRADGPRYVTDDGCMCIPGRSWVGNSSGMGCDQLIPPSFDSLVHTAGCELPAGASLPIGVCDGQLYPGESANRSVSCYASRGGVCRIGTRTCDDENGHVFDRECSPSETGPALPSAALCDAFLACERTACGDPMACLKSAIPNHKQLRCILPVSPVSNAGAGQPCPGGSWSVSGGALVGPGCAAGLLDGTHQGPVTLGWQREGETTAFASSSLCPPTFFVEKIEAEDPTLLPGELKFTISLDDQLFDVSLLIKAECAANPDAEANDLRCAIF